jgi:hypothetical protein
MDQYYRPRLPSGGQDINGLVKLLPLARDVGPPSSTSRDEMPFTPSMRQRSISQRSSVAALAASLDRVKGANSRRRRIGAIERCGRWPASIASRSLHLRHSEKVQHPSQPRHVVGRFRRNVADRREVAPARWLGLYRVVDRYPGALATGSSSSVGSNKPRSRSIHK